ncbi:MAG: hypothetical protein AAF517_00710 [Planctomycetota bacterium]
MKVYRRGIDFPRPATKVDWIVGGLLAPAFGWLCSWKNGSLAWFAFGVGVAVVMWCYVFRPRYGVINTARGVVADEGLERLNFDEVRLRRVESLLIVEELATGYVFFAVPDLSGGEFDRLREALRRHPDGELLARAV